MNQDEMSTRDTKLVSRLAFLCAVFQEMYDLTYEAKYIEYFTEAWNEATQLVPALNFHSMIYAQVAVVKKVMKFTSIDL